MTTDRIHPTSGLVLTAFTLLFVGLLAGGNLRAANMQLSGHITDQESGEPLTRVTIRVEGTGMSTLSNEDGEYRLRLPAGEYRIKYTRISHYSEEIAVGIVESGDPTIRNIVLRQAVRELEGVKVLSRAYDPGQAIIYEAIKRKDDILNRLNDYQYQAYTRLTVRDIADPDSISIFLIAESQTTSYWEKPDNYKEIITARKQTANLEGDNIILAVGEFLNFNSNRIELGDYSVVSPTAKDALDHYNYYLLDTLFLDNQRVFRLEIEPKNPKEPRFIGFIHIADSTFDVVEVDVGFTDAIRFPFLSNFRYSQLFAQFEGEYWMPVEIRFGADVDLGMPLPSIPQKMSFDDVASLYDFKFEQGIDEVEFDEFVLEVDEKADDYDSTIWAGGQMIPLTQEESQAYQTIDSIANVPIPLHKKLARAVAASTLLLTGMAEPFFHFNRVEGAYLGAEFETRKLIPRTDLLGRSGYAIDAKLWQHRYKVEYNLHERQRLYGGVEYRDRIVRRQSVNSSFEPTMFALFYKIDPYDYYREKGFYFSARSKIVKYTEFRAGYVDYKQYSAALSTNYSFMRTDKNHRYNPAIDDGRLRAVSAQFTYDSRDMIKMKGRIMRMGAPRFTRFNIAAEYSDPGFLGSDFEYKRYWASLEGRYRLGRIGISSIFLFAGTSEGHLPIQRDFIVDYGGYALFNGRGFNTLSERNFSGDRAASVYMIHDFNDLPFKRSGIPGLSSLWFTLSVHGGSFWTEVANRPNNDATIREAKTAYSEIGFGLSNLTPFLGLFNMSFKFTWQLSDYETNAFSMSWDFEL